MVAAAVTDKVPRRYETWREEGDFTELRGTYCATWKLSDGQWLLSGQIMTPLSCRGSLYCKAD